MRVIRCVRTSMGSNLIRLCVSELRSGMQIPIGGFCTRFCNLFCYFLRFFYLFGFHLTVAARRRFIKQASWVTDFAQFINTNYAAYALSFILFFFLCPLCPLRPFKNAYIDWLPRRRDFCCVFARVPRSLVVSLCPCRPVPLFWITHTHAC